MNRQPQALWFCGHFQGIPGRFRIWRGRKVHIALLDSRISTCVSGHLKVKKEPHHLNCLPPPTLLLQLFLAQDHSLNPCHPSSFTTSGSQPFISPGSQQLPPTLTKRSQFISPKGSILSIQPVGSAIGLPLLTQQQLNVRQEPTKSQGPPKGHIVFDSQTTKGGMFQWSLREQVAKLTFLLGSTWPQKLYRESLPPSWI